MTSLWMEMSQGLHLQNHAEGSGCQHFDKQKCIFAVYLRFLLVMHLEWKLFFFNLFLKNEHCTKMPHGNTV